MKLIRHVLLVLGLCLTVASIHAAEPVSASAERLQSFNTVQSKNNRQHIHAGVSQNGNQITLLVKDAWHGLSRDMKEDYVKNSINLFFGMGGARGIKEKSSDFNVEVKHMASSRVLATWDGLRGLRLVDEK